MRALRAVAEVTDVDLPGARILGAHMEGPYLSESRCGAQDPRSVRLPDLTEARRFLDTGIVRLITVAPELAGARELVALCRDADTTVSAGHTEASYEQMLEAVTWGVRHVTHAFNAMPPLHHRRPGVVGAAMTLPQLTAELIADNHHVHPAVLAAFLRAKGPDGVALVTDALRPTGLDSGSFLIGGRPAGLDGGVVRLSDGTMAGSVLTMDVALRNLVQATGTPVEELWPTSSRNGALSAGVGHRKGSLAVGMDADLVVVGPDVDVRMTVAGGRIVHSAPLAAPLP
jgi:N-acetylglucosamine-6-phosphate deacetylase